MIARLKSKKSVSIDPFKSVVGVPYCEIITWTHGDNSEDGTNEVFSANGQYYYLDTKEVNGEEVTEKKIIHTFVRDLKGSEADQLFPMLNVQYPIDATYSERKRLEVQAGLFYIVTTEKYWGLNGGDWEII